MKLEKNGFVRRVNFVVWKVVDGKAILLNLDSGAYFEVNPVGLVIWKNCDGRKTLSQIISATSRIFQKDIQRIDKEVRNFIYQLKRCRLVEINSVSNSAITRH